ncbi:response regulator [Sporosalibacterium faouarense]|uniref:response regulator n=1 Tax=Sporosalibacterium faouarense TaxID=516123 RepID=UPI00192AAA08|nr:response regulator [Sporosalibacterium faouarense]
MSKKILVVDDEKNIRMTLSQCLKGENYDVELAVNGEEGLNKLEGNDFDLVLLDIKMPGLTGMEVLKKLRDKGNNINVIMMTAYGTIEKAVEAMKLGAIDFLSKPFTPEEIRKLVNDVLGREALNEDELESFKDIVEFAKKCILTRDYEKAEEYLKKSIAEDASSPIPHNLLGVLAEYKGDVQRAQKHYRAALALDPTYKTADKNLERTIQMRYTTKGISLGGSFDEEE